MELQAVIKESYSTVFLVFALFGISMFILGFLIKRLNPLKVENNFQNIVELIFGFFEDTVADMVGRDYVKTFTPLAITMFITIFVTNLAGLIGLSEGARANPIYTLTWSFSMFLVWNVYGAYKVGIGTYIKDIFTPLWMSPLEIIGILTKPISMGFRLFGNITAGALLMLMWWQLPALLMSSFGILGVVPAGFLIYLGTFLSMYFSLFGPFIQALVFTFLTLVNVGIIIELKEEAQETKELEKQEI